MTTRPPPPSRRRLAGLTAALVLAGLLPPVLAPGPSAAHSYRFGAVQIGHVWAPPPKAGEDGVAVYGAILNRSESAVRLTGAASPVADSVRFRVSRDAGTSWPDAIEIAPGRPYAMAAWRAHVWLSGLHRELRDGDSFELTLEFGDLGRTEVTVLVESGPGH